MVVPVRKSGWAGTYFEVRTSEGLVASHEGVHNAFPIGEVQNALGARIGRGMIRVRRRTASA